MATHRTMRCQTCGGVRSRTTGLIASDTATTALTGGAPNDKTNGITPDLRFAWPLVNCWAGVSIENRRYVHRADLLRATPAAVRFISAEPLLGPLGARGGMGRWMDGYEGPGLDLGGIDWLIVGGESGPRARPMRLAWARALRDVCAERGVAFFLKQLGGARAGTKLEDLPPDLRIREYPRSAVTA